MRGSDGRGSCRAPPSCASPSPLSPPSRGRGLETGGASKRNAPASPTSSPSWRSSAATIWGRGSRPGSTRSTPPARWALLKLLTGALRVGVSARLAKTAVADMAGFKVDDIEEVWHAPGAALRAAVRLARRAGRRSPTSPNAPVFRPLMLSHPLEDADWAALDLAEFSAEWKWDGIRVQVVGGSGEARLYSRTGDDIGQSFPDVVGGFNFNAVLDGELLVRARRRGRALQRPAAAAQPQGRDARSRWSSFPPTCASTMRC